MYVKRHKVRRKGKDYTYLRLVEAFRTEDGKVRHRLLHTLGREDMLKASGQLDQLAASFARLDPPPVGTRRQVGALLLVRQYLQRLDLVKVIDRVAPMKGRAQLTHGEVICALVANRLSAPSPLYDVAGWASSAALAELFDIPAMLLNDDRLGRALEALCPVAEQVRGELALTAARTGGADLSRLHLDLTAVRFAGAYEHSAMVEKGWAADRSIGRQVRPCRPPPWTASRSTTGRTRAPPPRWSASPKRCNGSSSSPRPGWSWSPTPAWATCATCAPPTGPGCASWSRCAPTPAGPTGSWPTSATWTNSSTCPTSPNANNTARRPTHPLEGPAAPLPGHRPGQEVKTSHDLRVAYIWSSEEATSVAEARTRALAAAEAALTRVRNGLGGRYYKTQKDVDTKVARSSARTSPDCCTWPPAPTPTPASPP